MPSTIKKKTVNMTFSLTWLSTPRPHRNTTSRLHLVSYHYTGTNNHCALCQKKTMALPPGLRVLVVFATTNLVLLGTDAEMRCYSCSYTSTSTRAGYECVNDPAKVKTGNPLMDCSWKYCTTRRVVLKATNEVRSFERACSDTHEGTRCTSDQYHQTCYTSCSTDKCNKADATPPTTTSGPVAKPNPPGCAGARCGTNGASRHAMSYANIFTMFLIILTLHGLYFLDTGNHNIV